MPLFVVTAVLQPKAIPRTVILGNCFSKAKKRLTKANFDATLKTSYNFPTNVVLA